GVQRRVDDAARLPGVHLDGVLAAVVVLGDEAGRQPFLPRHHSPFLGRPRLFGGFAFTFGSSTEATRRRLRQRPSSSRPRGSAPRASGRRRAAREPVSGGERRHHEGVFTSQSLLHRNPGRGYCRGPHGSTRGNRSRNTGQAGRPVATGSTAREVWAAIAPCCPAP